MDREPYPHLPRLWRVEAALLLVAALAGGGVALEVGSFRRQAAPTVAISPTWISLSFSVPSASAPASAPVLTPATVASPAIDPAPTAAPEPGGRALDSLGDLPSEGSKEWKGIAVSPDVPGVIALWSELEIWLSGDNGGRFQRVLDGPGPVGAVVIGEDGTVYAIRGARLGALPAEGKPRWHELPFEGQTIAFSFGGDYLAWFARVTLNEQEGHYARLLTLSEDQGRSWFLLKIMDTTSHDSGVIRISDAGEIEFIYDESSAPDLPPALKRYKGRADRRILQARGEYYTPYVAGVGHDGTVYIPGSYCDGVAAVCVATRDGHETKVVGGVKAVDGAIVDDPSSLSRVLTDGKVTYSLAAEGLFTLRAGVAEVVSEPAPEGFRLMAIEGSDQVLGVVGGSLVRWSKKHGFRILADDKSFK
jgi:hypothetical protein